MCRATILRTLVVNDDKETIEHAKSLFAKHVSGENPISADLRPALYAAIAVNADEATINQLIEMHDKCDLLEEKMRIATSLGLVKNEELIKKVLKFSISVS